MALSFQHRRALPEPASAPSAGQRADPALVCRPHGIPRAYDGGHVRHPAEAIASRRTESELPFSNRTEDVGLIARHPHFRWIPSTLQARSQETLERLLDTADRLIAEKGFDDVPVAEIASRAGFSVGAFYARFPDKDALLLCLEQRFVSEARATTDACLDPERWRGASIAEIAEELVAFLVEIHRERSGILREILGRAPDDRRIGSNSEPLIAHICKRLRPLLLERRDEIGHPRPDLAADFAFRLVLGILKEAILFKGPGAHGIPASDESLAEELTRAFLAYLGVDETRAAGRSLREEK